MVWSGLVRFGLVWSEGIFKAVPFPLLRAAHPGPLHLLSPKDFSQNIPELSNPFLGVLGEAALCEHQGWLLSLQLGEGERGNRRGRGDLGHDSLGGCVCEFFEVH